MEFDTSDFTLSEIIRINKENLEKKFLRLNIENTEYVLFIDYISPTMMHTRTYIKNSYLNENNPIERVTINLNYPSEKENIDSNNYYFYYSNYLDIISRNHHITISELSDRANEFLNLLLKNKEMLSLLSANIELKKLEKPISPFEKKFSETIKEICFSSIDADKKTIRSGRSDEAGRR